MAEEKNNIYKRLMQARIDFAMRNVQPSGYNPHLNFDYLELKDIIPVADEVMMNNDIMLVTTFLDDNCVGQVVDLLGKEEPIVFTIPLPNPEKDAERLKLNVVAMQGAQVTYLRRYMIMLVLDICINDEIDADGDEKPVVAPSKKSTPNNKKSESKTEKKATTPVVESKKKAPVAPEKRAEIKKELTNADGGIDDLQKSTLLSITQKWVNLCPEDKELATNILVKTNGYSTCTRKEAEELIDTINKKIEDAEKE